MRIEGGVVLDASAYLRSTQRNILAVEYLRAYAYGKIHLYAPPHFHVEVANVLRKSVIAGQETGDDARLTLNAVLRMKIEVDRDPEIAFEALEFALERGTSVYDAAYVVVAVRHEASLITADSGLAQAAQTAGVVVTLLNDEP